MENIILSVAIPFAFIFIPFIIREAKGYKEKIAQIENDLFCKQQKYDEILVSEDFLSWQNKLLKSYYGKEYFTHLFGEDYPAHIFKGINHKYPFKELCNCDELDFKRKIKYENTKYYKKYKSIIQPDYSKLHKFISNEILKEIHKVKRPKMQGFMLDKLEFDNKLNVKHLKAWVGTYADNVYTSHILEYENYALYRKYKDKSMDIQKDLMLIKRRMTMRNKIHRNEEVSDVLKTGCNRASLMGIQLIVILKDRKDHQYKILLIKRSDEVAIRPGFYQFVPAAVFEILGEEVKFSDDILKKNFSFAYVLLREIVEELYDEKRFEKGKIGSKNIEFLLSHERVKEIDELVKKGGAQFEFLGSVVDLATLKNELSFVLRIDDEEYPKRDFEPCYEARDRELLKIPVSEFESMLESTVDGKIVKKIFYPASIAAYSLLKENHLYKEIMEKSKSQ